MVKSDFFELQFSGVPNQFVELLRVKNLITIFESKEIRSSASHNNNGTTSVFIRFMDEEIEVYKVLSAFSEATIYYGDSAIEHYSFTLLA